MKAKTASALAVVLLSAATAHGELRAVVVASGLQHPIAFVQDPSDPTVQFVAQQNGIIRSLRNGLLQSTIFLDISNGVTHAGEMGLLGLAFPPDYATSGRFYVHFNDTAGNIVVARFRRSAQNPNVADRASGRSLRWSTGLPHVVKPFGNHNGGCLRFGPDGYLYVALGDGGGGGDPGNRAQNPNELLGKILRIDVSIPDEHPAGFVVPPDNPLVDGQPVAGRPEIWSIGLRNPWQFSFDDPNLGGTGAMIVGDVGQGAWEEIDYEPAGRGGRNYGWPVREGAHDYDPSRPRAYLPLIDPIHEYDRVAGRSVTGGYVYRGRDTALRGRYFFADFITGRVWSVALTVNPTTGEATASGLIDHTAQLGPSVIGNVSAFGVDALGDLYVLNYTGGTVVRIESGPTHPTNLRIRR
jgi:glucose/arabinose dehydrogenase